MSLDAAMRWAVEELRTAGIEAPESEARRLLGAVFPKRYVDYEEVFTPEFEEGFRAAVARRASHEPLSHITGRRDFWNHVFQVNAAVLDPRPDTETLVEAALAVEWQRVLDLGTGSGCILLSLLGERPDAFGIGTDISSDALEVARRNANVLELDHQMDLLHSDWFSDVVGPFDLIVSNPPYIDTASYEGLDRTVREFEPKLALTPGETGLEAYEVIVTGTGDHLEPGGWLMVEIGHDQGAAVQALFQSAGFTEIRVLPDINGKDRVVQGKKAPQ